MQGNCLQMHHQTLYIFHFILQVSAGMIIVSKNFTSIERKLSSDILSDTLYLPRIFYKYLAVYLSSKNFTFIEWKFSSDILPDILHFFSYILKVLGVIFIALELIFIKEKCPQIYHKRHYICFEYFTSISLVCLFFLGLWHIFNSKSILYK